MCAYSTRLVFTVPLGLAAAPDRHPPAAPHVLLAPRDARRPRARDSGTRGHQDLRTTQRYMHLSPAALDGAIRLQESQDLGSARGETVETGDREIVQLNRRIEDSWSGLREAKSGRIGPYLAAISAYCPAPTVRPTVTAVAGSHRVMHSAIRHSQNRHFLSKSLPESVIV